MDLLKITKIYGTFSTDEAKECLGSVQDVVDQLQASIDILRKENIALKEESVNEFYEHSEALDQAYDGYNDLQDSYQKLCDKYENLRRTIVQAKHELNSVKMDGSHVGKAYMVLHGVT